MLLFWKIAAICWKRSHNVLQVDLLQDCRMAWVTNFNSSLRLSCSPTIWKHPVGGFLLDVFSPVLVKVAKKVREKSRECHNHKPQPFPDPKKRKPTNLNKHKPNKRTKSTKISSLFPKRGNRNTKRTEKHKNKMTHGKTYNKSSRRINHKATKSKTNTGTTALERSVEQTTGGGGGGRRGLKQFYS